MRVSPLLSLPITFLLAAHTLAHGASAQDAGRSAAEAARDGNTLLAQGAYSDAARAYSEAIEAEPASYINYYKRATAYLSSGRHNAALDDFDKILQLNPGFTKAHFQKAKILAKEGDFDSAAVELKAYGNADAAASDLSAAVSAASNERKAAKKASKNHKWHECVEHTSKAIDVGSNSAELRELRVHCNTELGDAEQAYADLSRLAALNPSSQELRIRLANMAYFLLDSSMALPQIKQCLHYDPDSKKCKAMHKLIRSLEKEATKARNFLDGGSYRKALNILRGDDGLLEKFDLALKEAEASEMIPLSFHAQQRSSYRRDLYALACRASVDASDFTAKAAKICDQTLKMDPDNESGLVFKGERLLKEAQFEQAVAAFQQAFEQSGRQSQDIVNRLQKAQRMLKVSKQKDYYKVLGVSRDADDRTIKKAFRKAAKANHPDVGGSEEKMQAINEAYEVLSDEELRARYDNGDDPNDPGGGQGGNPFAHHGSGGMPFFFQQGGGFPGGGFPGGGGGGGGGRKFHFEF